MHIQRKQKLFVYLCAALLLSFSIAWPQQSAAPPVTSQPRQQSAPPSAAAQPSSAATPQQHPQQQQTQHVPETTLTVNTRLVSLDVVVTDKSGNPATDLKKEDFTILERGQPQRIASFNLQQPKLVDANKPASVPPPLPPGVYGNRREEVATSPSALTVVLLDALNTPMADQAYARYGMLNYLKSQHGGQSTAIYALTSRLLLLQDFTADPGLLRAAIEKKVPQPSHLLSDPDQQVEIPGATDTMVANLDRFEQDQVNFQNDMRIRITMDAMKSIARSLSGYAGRKNLVWVSAAFPLSAAFEGDSSAYFNQNWMMDEVQRTATLLTDSHVSVYPVDARGLVGSPLASATFSGRTRGGRLMNGPQLGSELNRRSFALTSSHDAMTRIAESTGGRAYYNRNDIDHAIALSIADGSTYYTVTYYPDDKAWNGKFRKVEIKLSRTGLQARYRHGYYATDPLESAKMSNSAVQRQIDEALGDPIPSTMITVYGSAFKIVPSVTASQGRPQPEAATNPLNNISNSTKSASAKLVLRQKVSVRFLVEPAGIAMEKRGDREHFSVDFDVAAFRGQKVVAQLSQTMEGNPTSESFNLIMKQGLLFVTAIEVPSGNCRLRLLVHDNQTGRVGAVDVPITDATPTVKQ